MLRIACPTAGHSSARLVPPPVQFGLISRRPPRWSADRGYGSHRQAWNSMGGAR